MKKLASLLLITFFAVQSNAQNCSNKNIKELVRNGDFEAGYLTESNDPTVHAFTEGGVFDFYSDFTFVGNVPNYPSNGCTYGIADKYAVGKRENFTCSATSFTNNFYWGISYGGDVNFTDHTANKDGEGFAFVVDPNTLTSSSKTGGNPIIWEQVVLAEDAMTYTFSAWIKQFSGGAPAVVELVVVPVLNGVAQEGNRTIIASGSPVSGYQNWTQIQGNWNTTSKDSVAIRLELKNSGAGSSGADLVIDDISCINSCQNADNFVNKWVTLSNTTAELCSSNGTTQPKLTNLDGSDFSLNGNQKVYWYTGEDVLQTKLDSITDNLSPIFKTPGEYRVCFEDTDNGVCATSKTIEVIEDLELSISGNHLCDDYSTLIATNLVDGSNVAYAPEWTLPSGEKVSSYNLEVFFPGTYTYNVTTKTGYNCDATGSFSVTSGIPQATEDTVEYCTNESEVLQLSSEGAVEFDWAYDSAMTDPIGTGSMVNLTAHLQESYYVYFRESENEALGTLNSDTTVFTGVGAVSKDVFEIHEENVVIEEVYLKTASWSSSCSGIGSTAESYIVFDGPTYDSIPFNINCGRFTKVVLNFDLAIGEYEVRVKDHSNLLIASNALESLPDYVTRKNSGTFGDEVFLAKAKFSLKNVCASGRLYVKGEACSYADETCSTSSVTELVRNGDFEAGYLTLNTSTDKHEYEVGGLLDFYSDGELIGNIPNEIDGNCEAEHQIINYNYFVAKAENFTCGAIDYTNHVYFGANYEGAANFNDHTPGKGGKGFALITEPWLVPTKSSKAILWEQKVAVTSGNQYTFSTWAALYDRTNPALIHLAIVPCVNNAPVEGSKVIVQADAPDSVLLQWTQIAGTWTADQGVDSVYIRIEFDFGGALGAELIALDDISFTNSCSNVDSEISNHYYIDADTVELCAAGGEVAFEVLNENGSDYTTGNGKNIYWYTGDGSTQTLLDSINNNAGPIFKTKGDFRVCIEDPSNGCVINQNVHIKEALDLGLEDVELCDAYSVDLTTPVKAGSKSCDIPKWTYPSGDIVYAYDITTSEPGDYFINVGRLGSYKCKKGEAFTITSNIPTAAEDTVEFCTTAPDNIYVESSNGETFVWAYDSLMTDLIDTTAGFWLPEATEDAFDVYFKSFEASGSVGTLSDDTSSYSTLGYTYHDIFEIHEDNIILEEAYIKFAFWEIGCSGQGSTFDSYIVIDGPTYDSIPFTANCGNFTKIDLDVTLQQGDYVVRVKKNSNVYNWEDNYTHLAGSVTQKTGLTSEYKMLAKVKFGRTNSCLPGRLHAKGKFCDFTSVEDVNKQALVIYPNPTTGIVNFSTVAESVEVFSIEGRMVGQFNNTETINLSKLNRGTYLIKADGKVATVIVK